MAEIEKLVDNIKKESQAEAEIILNEAKKKANDINEKFKLEAKNTYDKMISKAKEEIATLKEKQKNAAILKSRDRELMAKQIMIAKVFDMALKQLEDINDDDYINYLKKYMDKNDDNELIVMKSKIDVVEKNFPNKKISKTRFVDSGFIEAMDGVEKNYTFKSQLDYIKDDMQLEIAKILFD